MVVSTNNADIIATVVNLKEEIEAEIGSKVKVTILGGAEAHIIAHELARANVGVILTPPRPYVSIYPLLLFLRSFSVCLVAVHMGSP